MTPATLKRMAWAVLTVILCGCASQYQGETADTSTGEKADRTAMQDSRRGDRGILSRFRVRHPERQAPAAAPVVRDDVWTVIDGNLGFARDVPAQKVRAQIKRYANNQKYFDRNLKRAELYLPYVLEQVLEADLPAEIALLPFVESAYNPFARSHSGAAGLWQFIPSTGDHLELERNHWYDGRRDVVTSTAAAITYLQTLNSMFEGDWLLTLAAYNAGPGTVQQAVEENRRRGKPVDFWSLDLRRETVQYVPRLIALTKVIADPDTFGVELQTIGAAPAFTVVDLDRPVDLNRAADLADISTDRILKLNPGYSNWVTPPSGPFHLFLPSDLSPDFAQQLAALPEDDWQPLDTYRVAAGDTLSLIAARNNLSVEKLAKLNKIDTGGILSIGQTLVVPRRLNRSLSGATATPAIYRVKSGDSLWTIASANEVTVDDLLAWNNLSRQATLQPGQTLIISPADKTASRDYKVRSGDSLYSIARRHKVKLEDLIAWNNLSAGALLRPGQVLKVLTF